MKFGHTDIQELLKLLDEAQYTELRLETDDFRLWLRRGGDGGWSEAMEITARPSTLQSGAAASVASAAPETRATPGLTEVRSPLPGTFYRSPQPGAPPFVEIGDEVAADTVVCIIETMKLMNSIHAGTRGRIREICIQNASPAAKEQVLMRIEAASS